MSLQAAGITAEYNPFHNGHLWQLQVLRQKLGDVPVIVCMSGCFVQRGEAALCDPWTRAAMAVQAGADLVLRLPAWYSLRSADYFAAGAVRTLAATSLVRTLVCGVEHAAANSTPLLQEGAASQEAAFPAAQAPNPETSLPVTAAWSLAKETGQQVRTLLQQGLSYGAAWETAAAEHNMDAGWFTGANNILALAYQKAIIQHELPLQMLTLPRQKIGHNDIRLRPQFSSATAIRQALQDGVSPAALRDVMPEVALALLKNRLSKSGHSDSARHATDENTNKNATKESHPGHTEAANEPTLFARRETALTALLAHLLARNGSQALYGHSSASRDLCDRFHNARNVLANGYTAFCQAVASKRDSLPAVRRLSLQLLLQQPRAFWTVAPEPSYLRVLAFNDRGRSLLKEMKQTAALPVITKPGSEEQYKNTSLYPLLQTDAAAADLFQLLNGNPGAYGTDFTTSPVYIRNH